MLKKVAENIWCTEDRLKFPPLPLRMTIIKLADGGLWLHSPISMDDATARAIQALGDVKFIVSPNKIHHLFVQDAKKYFPHARMYAAPGLAEKRKDFEWDETLGNEPPAAWCGEFEQHFIGAAAELNEVVFFHKPTRTLLAADFVFNLQQPPKGLFNTLILKALGTYKKFAMSRLWSLKTQDKESLAASVQKILSWDVERVIMCHGDVVEPHAKDALIAACARYARST